MSLHEEWLVRWESPPSSSLQLRNPDMERICRALTSQRDVYELCRVHPIWQKAATDVLWEAPQFRTLVSFDRFVKSASQHKRLAMVVKRLSLMLHDQHVDTVFVPHVYSDLSHHRHCHYKLTESDLIQHLAQQCEHIQSLRIYGWFLHPVDLESLGSRLQHLEELTLVGCSSDIARSGVIQRGLLSKLRRLCLDGPFMLSESFVTALKNRALHSLQSLQIPLPRNRDHMISSSGNISNNDPYARATHALIKSLARTGLELRSLTLTSALYMNHDHIRTLTQNFPELEELVVDGILGNSTYATIMALTHSLGLKSLDIRADENSVRNDPNEDDDSICYPHGPLVLEKLLLTNVDITDKQLMKATDEAHEIKILGLSHCPWVTNLGVIHLVDHNPLLHTLHLIHCRHITDSFFEYLGDMNTTALIHDIHVEHCGALHPRILHQMCCRGVSHGLRRIKLVGYDDITRSVIGKYAAAVNHDTNSIILDQQSIMRVAELDIYDHRDLTPTLQSHYLTGEHIVLLSKELGIAVTRLVEAIERVQQCDSDSLPQHQNKEALTTSPGYEEPHTRSEKPSATKQIPTTPMLWDPAEQSNTEEYIQQPILRPRIEESSLDDDQSDTNTPLSKSSTSDRAESPTSVHSTIIKDFRQHDEQVEEDEPRSYGNENRSDFGSTSQSDMDLGGWGTVGSWDNTASKSKSTSVSPTQKQQSQEGWGAESVTEWDHVKQQRQQHEQHQQSTSIDPPATPSLITSSAADVEGWGTPKDVVAWKDLRKQGYAYQVIEDQRKSFSSDNDRAWSAAISRTPSPRQQDTTTSPPRKSLLSPDDELIDWDDDDGVTILTETHTNTRMPTNTTTTTTRTQSPATGKMKGPPTTPKPHGTTTRSRGAQRGTSMTRGEIPTHERAGRGWGDFLDASRQSAGGTLTDNINTTMTHTPPQTPSSSSGGLLIDTSDTTSTNIGMKHSPTSITPIMDSAVWRDVSSLADQHSTTTTSNNDQQTIAETTNVLHSSDNTTTTTTTIPSSLTPSSATEAASIHSASPSSQRQTRSTGSPRDSSRTTMSKNIARDGRKLMAKCTFDPQDNLPPIEIYDGEDLKTTVENFCQENNIMDKVNLLYNRLNTWYTDHRTEQTLSSYAKKKRSL